MTYPWAAGEVLTAADLNAYAGLIFITEATATSGTSLSVNNCFSTQFRNYRIVVSTYVTATASNMQIRLRASGTDNTDTDYYSSRQRIYYDASATSIDAGSASTTWWMPNISSTTAAEISASSVDIFNPNSAANASIAGIGHDSRSAAGTGAALYVAGTMVDAGQYDGFTLVSAQTISSLTVRVYGYNNG